MHNSGTLNNGELERERNTTVNRGVGGRGNTRVAGRSQMEQSCL